MADIHHINSIFAVHPTARGFGWVYFDNMGVLADWGMASADQGRKLRLMHRFERLLDRHEPAVLVVEAHDNTSSERIKALFHEFMRHASGRGIEVRMYDRGSVSVRLGLDPDASRHDIAQKLGQTLDGLSHRMPRKQRAGRSADPRESLFAAAALALAYIIDRGLLASPTHSGAPE